MTDGDSQGVAVAGNVDPNLLPQASGSGPYIGWGPGSVAWRGE